MLESVRYIYLNGLGDGTLRWHDKLVCWWWAKTGTPLEHFPINWYSDSDLSEIIQSISNKVDEVLKNSQRIVIIGSSAGGSLALNVLHANKDKEIVVILAHARLVAGNYPPSSRMSLENRAKKSKLFYKSVKQAESTIPLLSSKEKQRILTLTQLTDGIVPINTMTICGAKSHRSIAFGHSGAYLAHVFFCKPKIIQFSSNPPESYC